MTDAGHSLYIKYGLGHAPTDAEIVAWASAAEAFIIQGLSAEEAGEQAAKQVFPDYRSFVYKSQADTIEMLLLKAKEK